MAEPSPFAVKCFLEAHRRSAITWTPFLPVLLPELKALVVEYGTGPINKEIIHQVVFKDYAAEIKNCCSVREYIWALMTDSTIDLVSELFMTDEQAESALCHLARNTLRTLIRQQNIMGVDVAFSDIYDFCAEPHDPPAGCAFQTTGLVLLFTTVNASAVNFPQLCKLFYTQQKGPILVPLIGLRSPFGY